MSDDFRTKLAMAKRRIEKEKAVTLRLPIRFSFRDHGVYDFEPVLAFFDWTLKDRPVRIDLSTCKSANYQALSLLVAYAWCLRNQGCTVSFNEDSGEDGASSMWRQMGARGLFQVAVHQAQNFKGHHYKPLIAIRNNDDFKIAISSAEGYTKDFNVEYSHTLRYVLSELLYNTLEHGKSFFEHQGKLKRVPSLVQFTWYKNNNEIQFIIADTGVGIKQHLEQAYPGQESHEAAIKLAIKPQISGTFGSTDPYKEKNNAGVGLYISSNIIRRLNADMHIVSGDGVLHVSPRDITGRTINAKWPGALVLVTLRLEQNINFYLHQMMQEFRNSAKIEQQKADHIEQDERFYLSMTNYFGIYAEDKGAAISFRNSKLLPAVLAEKNIVIDFDGVLSAPHSFLSALIASPIKQFGMSAYKKIKILNASPEIRETIDFILDENTD